MSLKELLGMENLLFSNELSVEEYFGIVVSSTELSRAKTTVANVINNLRNSNDGDGTNNSEKLQNLYEDFFQTKIDQVGSGSQDSSNSHRFL